MAFPQGVYTCTVTSGPYLDVSGRPLEGTLTIVPSSSLIYNGTPLLKGPVGVKLVNGQAEIDLPCTDQSGMSNGTGSVTNWTYRAVIRFKTEIPGSIDPMPFSFSLPLAIAGSSYDLDDALAVPSSPGEVIPNLVSQEQLSSELAAEASARTQAIAAVAFNLDGKASQAYVDSTVAAKAEKSYVDLALADKVDLVEGLGLSANDYTSDDKTKLAGTVGNLRALGASGMVADDASTALQAFVQSVAKGSGVPAVSIDAPAGTYRITQTILFDRIAPKLCGAGTGNPGDHANPGRGTTFIWDGPAGQPMFLFRDCQNVVFEDVLLLGNDSSVPSELIYFENDGSSGQVGTNQMITFTRVTFGRYGYANTTYPGHSKTQRCVRFGGVNVNNDQAWFYDCQFGGASDALVAFDNSNTLWCNFINCYFDGRSMSDLTTPTAVGLRTNACVVLINPQFNRCNPDISAQNGCAYVYMWNSENSAQFASIGNSAGVVAHGGAMVAHSATMGTNMFDATSFGTDGELSLTDIRFRTALPMWPKIKVRGSASTLAGRLVVRDCGLPADCYDVQAHATGTGGVSVKIDDGDLFLRKHLRFGETLLSVASLPLRVSGYTSDATAVTDLLAQLGSIGLIQSVAQASKTTRTNTLLNPRFVSSGSGWTKNAGVTATTVGDTLELLVNTAITAGISFIYNTTAASAAEGEVWSAGITVKMTGNTTRQRLRLELRSYAGNTIRASSIVEFAPGEEKRMYVDGAVIATGDTQARLVLVPIDATLPVGVTVTLSKPVLEKAPVAGAPFTGASTISGWTAAWTGTADNSTSTLTPA